MTMNVVFRADASRTIGSGHVMRCLTLADALPGIKCHFICRDHEGHLASFIRAKGYPCYLLSQQSRQVELPGMQEQTKALTHANWLGVSWQTDARQTAACLADIKADWLVVDHYALDHAWESALQAYYQKLLVIDDLADRPHSNADVLLDQTLGCKENDYRPWVADTTKLLLGSDYALLRPEFSQWREYSLKRRQQPELKNMLVNLGGVDKDNVTGVVLAALTHCNLPDDCSLVVVMGASAPHAEAVKAQAAQMPWQTSVLQGVDNMAELMANADFAIGAAGSTSWERCCLGLPAVMLVLAENQQRIAHELVAAGACEKITRSSLASHLPAVIKQLTPTKLKNMAQNAALLCDGKGVDKMVSTMTQFSSLRKVQQNDLALVREWRNHPDVRRFMYTQHEITAEEHQQWFERMQADPNRHLLLYIEQGKPMGYAQLTVSGQSADWGFYTAPGAIKGTGRKLARQVLNYAFNELALEKIRGEALTFNEGSIGFHKSLGFKHESTLKTDVLCFGLLRSEWLAQQQ